MSYNRGNMRRDSGRRSNDFGSGGSRDFGGGNNRRGGGGGNYHNNYGNFNSPMNPWEGGMVPGRSGNSGLLPSPGQGDLLSQLTSPEAQLALASNLINKLINQQQQSTPALLNLGNMGSGGGHMSSFNDGYGNTRNFQDRRRGRMDQRRTEPYNKSGINRRLGTDRRNLGKNRNMGSDRKTSFSKSPKAQKDEKDKKDRDADKANGDVKTDSTEESKREEDEKKDEEKELIDDDENKEKKKLKEKAPPIPAALLYCHVCCKNMWDEISFTKHLKGRPHQLMMDGLNEKYKLNVDLLRHEMRLAEQQREMELERKQRQGMKIFSHPREYCAMCDLHFHGNLIPHRKNIRHQKLKAFLHPKCSHCNKEFSTRLEWDDHRLTFAHLKKVAEFRRVSKPNIRDDEFDIDELVCPDTVNCGEMVTKEVPVLMSHHAEEDIPSDLKDEPLKERDEIKKEVKEEGDDEGKTSEGKSDENKDKEEEDAPQGIDVDPTKLPKYNPAVAIGKDLVVAVSGFMCRVCNRFIQGEEESQVHCRTLSHHYNYCNIVRAKARITGRKKRGQEKSKDGKSVDEEKVEGKCKEEKVDDSTTDVDRSKLDTTVEDTDDEGNWKRRKVNENTEEEKKENQEMDVDDLKNENDIKEEISDSVWEEVDKDIESVYAEIQKDGGDDINDEDSAASPSRRGGGAKGGRGGARGRRGGRRGK